MNGKRHIYKTVSAAFCATTLLLGACDKTPTPVAGPAPSASSAPAPSGSQASAYTPPSADQLYQMVAPIALFPDNLVAQVLAGSTYPDQITAAENLVAQNPNLKGALLQTDVSRQSWDPSVQSLTGFPSVLDQMAHNIQWTTSLGEAYVNDPTDVLNAIQVMRQRASQSGNLATNSQQCIVTRSATTAVASAAPPPPSGEPVYQGPAVVPAPTQIIEVTQAQPNVVYVPSYDPAVVYGAPVPLYPSYAYAPPPGPNPLVVGAIGFGVGIAVAALFDHGGGWHNWGMNWGGHYGGGGGGGWGRPAVVYNHNTYVSRSTTVINHFSNVNNYNRTVNNFNRNNNNTVNNRFAGGGENPRFGAANAPRAAEASGRPMSMPNFNNAMRNDHVPGAGNAENRAATGENRMANAENRQAAGENHVANAENRQATGENRMANAENRQAAGENHAANAENHQAAGENRAANAENRQAQRPAGETRSEEPRNNSAAERQQPARESAQHATPEHRAAPAQQHRAAAARPHPQHREEHHEEHH